MKYSNDRDAALHYLMQEGWSTGEAGNIPEQGWYAWKTSNEPAEVWQANTEINSVLEPHFAAGYQDSQQLRDSLVGHFVITEIDDGHVSVVQYPTEADASRAFDGFVESEMVS